MQKFLGILLSIAALAAPELIGDDALRRAALEKPRRIIINNDGCDATEYPAKLPFTRENFNKQMLDMVKGRAVDTVTYCPFGVGLMTVTRSRVTTMHTGKSVGKNTRNLTPELFAADTDPLQLAVEFCRANGFEIFASMRVNDHHDQWHPQWLSEFKKQHPQWLFGTREKRPPYGAWSGLDFAQKEVRTLFSSLIAELIGNYDVDGLDLDFLRQPVLFKSVAWGGVATPAECAALTELMRAIRREADRVGQTRGRHLVIAIRVPDSLELCRAIGYEIDRWMEEKLIDILIPAGDAGRFNTYADAVALGHRYGTQVYPSIDTSWMPAGGPFNRNDYRAYTAQTAAALAAGADGIYYFNMFYAPNYLPQIRRSLAELATAEKNYLPIYQRITAFSSQIGKFDRLAGRQANDALLSPGQPVPILFEIGDDFATPAVAENRPQATLYLKTRQQEQQPLTVSLNGRALAAPKFTSGGEYRFAVPVDALRPGANTFSVTLAAEKPNAPLTILSGRELLRGNQQPPWRRLFPAHDFANAEAIEGEAYRLSDSGSATSDIANLLYPLPDLSQSAFRGEFDLKVQRASTPESVVMRIANGAHVEVITFEPERVGLKFAKLTKAFRTDDAFHHYEVELAAGRITVKADGAILFATKLTQQVTAEAGKIQGNNLAIPYMDERSLLIGSLSGPGIGSAWWKNLRTNFAGAILADAALHVRFAGKGNPALEAALTAPLDQAKVQFAAREGAFPRSTQLVNTYTGNHLAPTAEGTLLFNHDNARDTYALIRVNEPAWLRPGKHILVAECRVKIPPATADPAHSRFQLVLSPESSPGKVRSFPLRFFADAVSTPWGKVQHHGEFITCRIALDPTTGDAAAVIGGQRFGGVIGESNGRPILFFGDGSSVNSGQAEVQYVRIDSRN